jgi:hypothetical protein
MSAEPPDQPMHDPLAQLERALIDEFLRLRGYDPATIGRLAKDQFNELMKEASVYASAKLSEVETRAHYVDELHHATDPLSLRPTGRGGRGV